MAAALGWRQRTKVRRPKGYWDSLDNVRAELDEFIEEQGAPQGVMPPKADFVRAGRYDIARAVERWGGLYEVRHRWRVALEGGQWMAGWLGSALHSCSAWEQCRVKVWSGRVASTDVQTHLSF